MSSQTMCNDCAFHVKGKDTIECIHPDESGVNCSIVIFCSSFQTVQEIDSPCVAFGSEEEESIIKPIRNSQWTNVPLR
jgi:hypothetical protein